MEASGTTDPFAAATSGVEPEDPFGGVDPEGFGEDPASELGEEFDPTPEEYPAPEEPPVVNREGEQVAPDTHTTAGASRPEGGLMEPTTAPAPPQDAESAPAAPEAPPAAPTPPEAPAAPQTGAQSAQANGAEAEVKPPRSRTRKRAKGKGSENGPRLYRPLYQTDKDQWTEVKLTGGHVEEIKDHLTEYEGKVWIEANNIDQARRLAYFAAGRPRDGVRIVLVAEKGWRPKTVKPRPVVPREALEIS